MEKLTEQEQIRRQKMEDSVNEASTFRTRIRENTSFRRYPPGIRGMQQRRAGRKKCNG